MRFEPARGQAGHCPFWPPHLDRPSRFSLQWNLDITNLYIMKSSLERTIFFTPVIVKHMEKKLDITKPRYSEQILPVPWHFVISRLRSTVYRLVAQKKAT